MVLCCLEELELRTGRPATRRQRADAPRPAASRSATAGSAAAGSRPVCGRDPAAGDARKPAVCTCFAAACRGHGSACLEVVHAGRLVIGSGSPAVHLLAQGVIRTMVWNSVKLAAIPAHCGRERSGTAVAGPTGPGSGQGPETGRGRNPGCSFQGLYGRGFVIRETAKWRAEMERDAEQVIKQELDKSIAGTSRSQATGRSRGKRHTSASCWPASLTFPFPSVFPWRSF